MGGYIQNPLWQRICESLRGGRGKYQGGVWITGRGARGRGSAGMAGFRGIPGDSGEFRGILRADGFFLEFCGFFPDRG